MTKKNQVSRPVCCATAAGRVEVTLKTKVACNDQIEQFMCKQGKLDYQFR